ncbi:uncharacterized protein LOC107466037 [Arachis duranensis]|uniref:Uncharacterized protein LOC107466037 n=1 Tax=Arachis duranensis TaxID=130453 RepID=A0A6P4C5Y2_ARADU|nr:uncharacterized protein LOC107466037 [Arachis duranensis]
MAPYEALYGRKCQSPLCWYEAGEKGLLGLEMIAETTEQILERVRLVAYRMALPPHLSNLHDVFHVSKHRKYTPDASHVLEPESIQLKEDLTLPVAPVRIDDTSIKQLHRKEVSLVKVAWSRDDIEEHTWKLESEMRTDYPHLFSGN